MKYSNWKSTRIYGEGMHRHQRIDHHGAVYFAPKLTSKDHLKYIRNGNNYFQKQTDESQRSTTAKAQQEFDDFVDELRSHGVKVYVWQDPEEPQTPSVEDQKDPSHNASQ